MRLRTCLPAALAALALVAVPAPAGAAFFGATTIDGPSAGIVSLGDLDISRDGQGGIVYLKNDGGATHVYASRFTGGQFRPAQQIDAGLPGATTEAQIAAGDGGRMAAAFVTGGTLFATVHDPATGTWSMPQPIAADASAPAIDLSIHGAGFITYTSAGDVRAARLERLVNQFTAVAATLDIDPANVAGVGSGRSRVAIGADSTAVAVWGEGGHVFARRLYRTSVSTAPRDMSSGAIDGRPELSADLPEVDIEDDSSFAQVVYRGRFADGSGEQLRAVARRLRGSAVDAPVLVDGVGWGQSQVETVDVVMNGRGDGLASTGLATGVTAAVLKDDLFASGVAIGAAAGSGRPRGAASETTQRVVSWFEPGDGSVRSRFYEDRQKLRTIAAPGPEVIVSDPSFGAADPDGGLGVASNRVGDFVTVFVQGAGADRRLVWSAFDRLPTAFSLYTRSAWRNPRRSPISWEGATDMMGGVAYVVYVDGREIGRTTETRMMIPESAAIEDGVHRVKVTAVDARGQAISTPVRPVKLDGVPPNLTFETARRKRTVSLVAIAADWLPPSGRASGVRYVRIDFGDGSKRIQARRASHTYAKPGRSYTIRVSATDKAGNATVLERVVRIPKAKKPKKGKKEKNRP